MNDLLTTAVPLLARATIVLLVGGLVVGWTLRRLRPESAWIHRAAWVCVLLTGLCVAPIPISVPVLQPSESNASSRPLSQTRSAIADWRLPINGTEKHVVPNTKRIELSRAIESRQHSQSILYATIQFFAYLWMIGGIAAFMTGAGLWLVLQRIVGRATPSIKAKSKTSCDHLTAKATCPS